MWRRGEGWHGGTRTWTVDRGWSGRGDPRPGVIVGATRTLSRTDAGGFNVVVGVIERERNDVI